MIERLDERSKRVGGELDLIGGIAEQTKVLALNAVVADEVRTLATRSHDSTREIEQIVEQLQIGARDAVAVMNSAKQRAEERRARVEIADSGLNQIAEQLGRIRDLNAQMAGAAREQCSVTQDAGRNVVRISELAGHAATDAEQTTEVSNRLMELSDRLERLVRQFRL